MVHINVAELSYLLGLEGAAGAANENNAIGTTDFGESIKDNWDIMYDENPGVTCINAGMCSDTRSEPGPPDEGEAHFFAGCDEYHEPIGMGLALYAFERDDARPGRAKTVAVFASELG